MAKSAASLSLSSRTRQLLPTSHDLPLPHSPTNFAFLIESAISADLNATSRFIALSKFLLILSTNTELLAAGREEV